MTSTGNHIKFSGVPIVYVPKQKSKLKYVRFVRICVSPEEEGSFYLCAGLQSYLFRFKCKSESLKFIHCLGQLCTNSKASHLRALTYISELWHILNFPYQGCNISVGPQQVSQQWLSLPAVGIVLCN